METARFIFLSSVHSDRGACADGFVHKKSRLRLENGTAMRRSNSQEQKNIKPSSRLVQGEKLGARTKLTK